MPGHMGAKRVTIRNLEVIMVSAKENCLIVKGSIPGPKKGLVMVRESIKKPIQANLLFSRKDT